MKKSKKKNLFNPLLEDVQIDKEMRAREKPSDHVPIWVKIAA